MPKKLDGCWEIMVGVFLSCVTPALKATSFENRRTPARSIDVETGWPAVPPERERESGRECQIEIETELAHWRTPAFNSEWPLRSPVPPGLAAKSLRINQ